MGKFEGQYKIEEYTAYTFKTLAELSYTTNKGIIHIVPINFITDGASIPKLFWSIIGSPFTGLYKKPSLIHDELYSSQKFKRKYADRVFYDGMKDKGVSFWKRKVMYFAVRSCGWKPWNRHKKSLTKKSSHSQ